MNPNEVTVDGEGGSGFLWRVNVRVGLYLVLLLKVVFEIGQYGTLDYQCFQR